MTALFEPISLDPAYRRVAASIEAKIMARDLNDGDTLPAELDLARQFGVKRPGPLFNKRATFVIDTDRRVIDVIRSETNMDVHADQALATLAKRGTTPAAD